MKKIFAAFVIASFAAAALAATTWSSVTTGSSYMRAVKAAHSATAGTEPAPVTSTSTSEGLNLADLKGFSVVVETTSGGALTAGGTFQAYVWNKDTGNWGRAPDLDFVAYAVSTLVSPGYTVTSDFSRVLFMPSGVGTTTTVTYYGASKTGGTPRTKY